MRRLACAALALSLVIPVSVVHSQGIQVTRGIIQSAVDKTTSKDWEQWKETAETLSDSMPGLEKRAAGEGKCPLFLSAREVRKAADKFLRTNPSDPDYPDLLEELRWGLDDLIKVGAETTERSFQEFRGIQKVSAVPPPQTFHAFPEVSFTIGYGYSVSRGREAVHGFAIGTNLMGTAAGEVFGAIGVGALKDYFVNNTAMGIILPVRGAGKPSIDLGLGLGEIKLPNVRIWPVLGFQQIGMDDQRVPDDVGLTKADQKTWSSPFIGIGVLIGEPKECQDKLKRSGVVWIPSIGLELPFYYPGNAVEALGALFTDKQGDYVKSGNIGVFFSVSIPLLPTAPKKQG